MLPVCDFCGKECDSGGVLACRHLVCQSCGMSEGKCLVCATAGDAYHRKSENMTFRPSEMAQSSTPKESTPGPSHKDPRGTETPRQVDIQCKSPPVFPVKRSLNFDLANPVVSSPLAAPSERAEEPATKKKRKESATTNAGTVSIIAQAPTISDQVRFELRATGCAPRFPQPFVRTTGKVSVKVLADFIHLVLELPQSDRVILKCCNEELLDSMTLRLLFTCVWSEPDEVMVLEYGIAQGARGVDSSAC